MQSFSKSENDRLSKLLKEKLQNNADPKTKQWFDNYLKGAIEYRGLKTPHVTAIVKEWYRDNHLDRYSLQQQLELCSLLIYSPFSEDKFAGTIYIQQFLLSKIDYKTLLEKSNYLFQKGRFFDWSTTDWFCTRILDPSILSNKIDAATIISSWRESRNLWQRRASIVSFRHPSNDRIYHSLIEQTIEKLITEKERFIQTGIGWVLADMSKQHPSKAEAIFRQYLTEFSKEVIDRHTKHLDSHQELRKLKRQLL